jgi:hypothetical protein
MTNRIQGEFFPLLLQHANAETSQNRRDENACDDPLPHVVETDSEGRARGTRITEVSQETTDDQ